MRGEDEAQTPARVGAADPIAAVRALLDAWERLPRAARGHVLALLGATA